MSNAPRIAAAKRDWGHDETGCTVLHIDMDAFYASLETARHPELRGKPVIIGTGNRSVVSAASYEARRYGINSAMASARARQLCPDGIFLPVDMAYYRDVSHRIFDGIFHQVTDCIEKVSVDECFMDVSGALRQWGSPSRIGAWLRQEVRRQFSITCSVGIASNKLVAKMASTNAKPDGMLLIPVDRHAEFVQMMPLRGIPGIGPALERKLNGWGVDSVAALAKLTQEELERVTGSPAAARSLYAAARGIDARKVTPVREEKSIGAERTFDEDTRSLRKVTSLLRWCAGDVAETLRRRGLVGRTVTVKLRFDNLAYKTASRTVEQPLDSAAQILPVALALLHAMMGFEEDSAALADSVAASRVAALADGDTALPRLVRLAGISVSGLEDAATAVSQPTFDDVMEPAGESGSPSRAEQTAHRKAAEAALDAVRSRFGDKAAQLGF